MNSKSPLYPPRGTLATPNVKKKNSTNPRIKITSGFCQCSTKLKKTLRRQGSTAALAAHQVELLPEGKSMERRCVRGLI